MGVVSEFTSKPYYSFEGKHFRRHSLRHLIHVKISESKCHVHCNIREEKQTLF